MDRVGNKRKAEGEANDSYDGYDNGYYGMHPGAPQMMPGMPPQGMPMPPAMPYPMQMQHPVPYQMPYDMQSGGYPYPMQQAVPYPMQPMAPYPMPHAVPYQMQPGAMSYPMQPGMQYTMPQQPEPSKPPTSRKRKEAAPPADAPAATGMPPMPPGVSAPGKSNASKASPPAVSKLVPPGPPKPNTSQKKDEKAAAPNASTDGEQANAEGDGERKLSKNQRAKANKRKREQEQRETLVPNGVEMVDTAARCGEVTAMLLERKDPIAVDLEGVSLGRKGELCIVTVATTDIVYLFDICTLGVAAFEQGLKQVLESTSLVKLMFDCRQDADALWKPYGITLANVCDLQYCAVQKYNTKKNLLMGLKKTMEGYLKVFSEEDSRVKSEGVKLFDPKNGGSYDNWKKRPLSDDLLKYCAVDTKYFFYLRVKTEQYYEGGIAAATKRLAAVHTEDYEREQTAEADW